jgi:hypothetical protein
VTKVLDTNINKEDLVGIKDKLDKVLPLNKFEDSPHWSKDGISADQIYRIHKFVGRVVEETGVIIHGQIIDLFNKTNKIFPYRMQLIKIDKNTFGTELIVEDQICQTITPLNINRKTYVLLNESGQVEIPELVYGDYAIATYWTEYRDLKYKNWFIGKYMARYV